MKTSLQIVLIGVIGTVLIWPLTFITPVMAADESISQMIENAKTKADHEAIATYYEDQAKGFEGKAAEHKKMAAAYRIMPYGKGNVHPFVSHCNKLMNKYEELAKEDRELAKLHHQFAEQTD